MNHSDSAVEGTLRRWPADGSQRNPEERWSQTPPPKRPLPSIVHGGVLQSRDHDPGAGDSPLGAEVAVLGTSGTNDDFERPYRTRIGTLSYRCHRLSFVKGCVSTQSRMCLVLSYDGIIPEIVQARLLLPESTTVDPSDLIRLRALCRTYTIYETKLI